MRSNDNDYLTLMILQGLNIKPGIKFPNAPVRATLVVVFPSPNNLYPKKGINK